MKDIRLRVDAGGMLFTGLFIGGILSYYYLWSVLLTGTILALLLLWKFILGADEELNEQKGEKQ